MSRASHTFDDVADSNVFHSDIDWLAANGVTKGCNPPHNTKFCPSNPVTREQMAAFMHRLSGDDNRILDGRLDALEAMLAGVSRNGDILLFDGMNLQIVNGEEETFTSNSLGNVIIGYNESSFLSTRTGSHYLVIGSNNSYETYGGAVIGWANRAEGPFASVTGGAGNIASGLYSSVTGGTDNNASGSYSSISGGYSNIADKSFASVSGGYNNLAHADYVSILGGRNITVAVQDGIYPGP